MMNSTRFALFATVAMLATLSACNSLLDLDRDPVLLVRGDAAISCGEIGCACQEDADCADMQVCREHVCVDLDASLAPNADSGSDAGAEDAGSMDGSALDAEVDAGPCEDGMLRCAGSASAAREICEGGRWLPTEGCQAAELCDSQAELGGTCAPALGVCLGRPPHESFCDGKVRTTCGPDLVSATTEECASTAHCSAATGAACAKCLDNEAECRGDELWLCNAERPGFELADTCNPGECNETLADCTALVCLMNSWSCSGNVLRQCNGVGDAFLGEPLDCGDDTCDADGHQCDVCTPDALLGCEEGRPLRCAKDGQGVVHEDCAAETPVCFGAGRCLECEPNQKTCEGQTAVECDGEGKRQTTACPANRTCKAGSCIGSCRAGSTQCNASRNPEQCDTDGIWRTTDTCAANERCASVGGVHQCEACPAGYQVSASGDSCEEINECLVSPCKNGGACTDGVGSRTCACTPQWTGSDCGTDVDECAAGRSVCGDNARCVNSPGSRSCEPCPSGQVASFDGRSCVVNDACTAGTANCLPASQHGTCTSSGGTQFTCGCTAGYTGDGRVGGTGCSNVNECTNGANNCSPNANCTDSQGSFSCACKSGFTGNGVTCTDVDECTLNTDNCTSTQRCVNTTGSYTCQACGAGRQASADGKSCVVVDACAAGVDNCIDSSLGGVCTSTGGANFTCSCKAPEYTGNGVTSCTPTCAAPGGPSCGTRRSCQVSGNTASCVCNPAPASCPNGQAGKYCANSTTVGTCAADANGCVYINTAQSQTCDATQRLTCSSGTCVCTENDKLCDDDKSPLSCVSGRWIEFPACTSTQICRDKKGCVTNEPYEVGNYDNAGWVAYDIPNNFFYCFDFRLAHRATIEYFRFRGSGTGGRCDLGVYDDAGGKPGAFRTSNFDIMLATNGIAFSVPSATVTLNANTTYWLCGACFRNGGKVPLYVRAGRSVYFETTDYQFVTPATVTTDNEYTYPFFMQVRDVP